MFLNGSELKDGIVLGFKKKKNYQHICLFCLVLTVILHSFALFIYKTLWLRTIAS